MSRIHEAVPLTLAKSIRLLVLHPSTLSTFTPVCFFVHAQLDEYPVYEALSYTWGSSDSPKSILCDGRPFKIGQNCNNAIRDLRYRRTKRLLWIDAVCIDQTSKLERNHQVSMMTDIYRQAQTVCVYLGDSDGPLLRSIGFLSRLAQYLRQNLQNPEFDPVPDRLEIEEEDAVLLYTDERRIHAHFSEGRR